MTSSARTSALGAAAAILLFLVVAAAGPLLTLGLVAVAGIITAALRFPSVALVIWVLSLCFVPYWFGLTVGGYIPVVGLASILLCASGILRGGLSWQRYDTIAIVAAIAILLLAATGLSRAGHAYNVLFQWLPAYFAGRIAIVHVGREKTYRIIAIVMAVVAVIVIGEYLSGWNPYIGTAPNTAQYSKLGDTQLRGGVNRAEWAFGHAIALANVLAMSVAITLAARIPAAVRMAIVAALSVATALTFSRSGLVTIAAVLFLSVWNVREKISGRVKVATIVAVVVASFAVIPLLSTVFGSSQAETARSGNHRLTILENLDLLRPLGTARQYIEVAGVTNWNGIISIDNAFLRIAVNFGWILGLGSILIFLCFGVLAMSRRANAPALSLAAVTPALATVALITQFGSFVWFVVGLAMWSTRSRPAETATHHHERRITTPERASSRG